MMIRITNADLIKIKNLPLREVSKISAKIPVCRQAGF